MTGHDLDLREWFNDRAWVGAPISTDDDPEALLKAHCADCAGVLVLDHNALVAEVESLRAELAAAEQERDNLDRLAADKYHEARRLRAALAAVRELADRTLTLGGSDIEGWVNLADLRRALAAAEQDESKRDLLAGYVPTEDTTPEITDAVARSAAAWMDDEPKREQS